VSESSFGLDFHEVWQFFDNRGVVTSKHLIDDSMVCLTCLFRENVLLVGRFMLAQCTKGMKGVAKGRMFSEYENSIGTGQVHVMFDRPDTGWTK